MRRSDEWTLRDRSCFKKAKRTIQPSALLSAEGCVGDIWCRFESVASRRCLCGGSSPLSRGCEMQTVAQPKSLWGGELGLIAVLVLLFLLCLFIEARTIEPAYAFHMGLGVVAAAVGIFAILQRYNARPAERPPLEIDGLPNYNFAPVKVATLMALFWGLAGMAEI